MLRFLCGRSCGSFVFVMCEQRLADPCVEASSSAEACFKVATVPHNGPQVLYESFSQPEALHGCQRSSSVVLLARVAEGCQIQAEWAWRTQRDSMDVAAAWSKHVQDFPNVVRETSTREGGSFQHRVRSAESRGQTLLRPSRAEQPIRSSHLCACIPRWISQWCQSIHRVFLGGLTRSPSGRSSGRHD